MKQAPDSIYIVTLTAQRGEAIKNSIILRGFDEILILTTEQAGLLVKTTPPALLILDTEEQPQKTVEILSELPKTIRSLVLVNEFDESLFVSCYDNGTRDFVVKPVAEVYLIAKVLQALYESRMSQILAQKDQILVENGILSGTSGLFTTSYFLKFLQRYSQGSENAYTEEKDALSLLLIQLEGFPTPLPAHLQNVMMKDVGERIRECARGLDIVGEYFINKFAVLLPKTGKRGAKALANRIINRIHGTVYPGIKEPFNLELRVGIAEYYGCNNYEDLLYKATENLKSSELKYEKDDSQTAIHPI